jgi:hypothetical protein
MEATPDDSLDDSLAAVTWDYVAGFFDGEGSAGVYVYRRNDRPVERETKSGRIIFSNTDLACLEAIQKFIGAGNIYELRQKRTSVQTNVPCYSLVVYRIADLRRIIPELLQRCRIKGPALTEVLTHIEDKIAVPTYGALTELGVDAIRHMYWEEELTLAQIADRTGVRLTSVQNFMRRNNIPRRPRRRFPVPAPLAALGVDGIRRLYWDEGLDMAQIGARIGVDAKAVGHYMRSRNIPTRGRGPGRKSGAHLPL